MEPGPAKPIPAAELRRVAEQRLTERRQALPGEDTVLQRLVHELQVHQIELEMQNGELQLARDAMEAGLEKYSDLYDFAPVGYLTLDHDGRIREVNLTATALLGIERSRLMGRNLGRSLPEEDQSVLAGFLERTFQNRGREYCEVTLLRNGRTPIPVRIEATATASGRECRAAMTDITESRQAESYRFMLGKLQSAGHLAGGLARDYGELLATILLNLELAQTLTPPGEEFLAQRIAAAFQAALVAQGLTHELIALAPEPQPARTLLPLPPLLQACSFMALSGFPVQCTYSLPQDLWPVDADETQLKQAIRIMIINARESMPQGGVVSIHADNVVRRAGDHPTLPPGDYVRLSIADMGVGMRKDLEPRIFDPYFSTKPKENRPGLGLGLTICHAVIRRNGGAIEVDSVEGVGTTFHIDLPAVRPRTIQGPTQQPGDLQESGPSLPGSNNADPSAASSP
jgi:PAS domain S-box-containing protein